MTTASSTYHISFANDAALVAVLCEDLMAEQAALIAADLTRMEAMLEKRGPLLQSLAAAAKQRYDALAALGFEASENGMAAWLQQQADDKLNQAWIHFQKQLAQSKELNRLNGLLIHKHFQQNQEKLDVLTGNTASQQFYGKNGQTHGGHLARTGVSV